MHTAFIRRQYPLAEGIKKVAKAHLRRSGLAIYGDGTGGVYLRSHVDSQAYAEPVSLDDAWRGGYLQVKHDGTLEICGTCFEVKWDTVKIRRRMEEKLRKTTAVGELIAVASSLGVEIN